MEYSGEDPLKGLDPNSKQYKNIANIRRLKFLNKFQMMIPTNKHASTVSQSLQDPQQFFRCDYDHWPVCIFDFSFKGVLPDYFAFRSKAPLKIVCQYFYPQIPEPILRL
jgi:hypothetical protein